MANIILEFEQTEYLAPIFIDQTAGKSVWSLGKDTPCATNIVAINICVFLGRTIEEGKLKNSYIWWSVNYLENLHSLGSYDLWGFKGKIHHIVNVYQHRWGLCDVDAHGCKEKADNSRFTSQCLWS